MTARSDCRVLFVDDDEHIRRAAAQALDLAGYRVTAADGAAAAVPELAPDWPGVLVTDVRMPHVDGFALMRQAIDIDRDIPVVLVTGHGDISMAVQAIRDGAYDFIEKPFASDRLVEVVARAMEKRCLVLENRTLKAEVDGTGGPRLIGRAPALQALRARIAAVADTDANVLVHGETGSGKELVARSLHAHGRRRDGPFVALNCGAMPETLIESELFGHEAGAFTGATARRIGKFEHARGGTVFLDEIESMPLALQVRLLRVLQERAVERLGSNKLIPLDIRVVAATKSDLARAAAAGTFREDLFYRLAVVTLDIPPLRNRREDIPLLFRHFVLEACGRYDREPPELSPGDVRLLMARRWPGNVRELQNAAERLVLFHADRPDELARLLDGVPAAGPGTLPQQVDGFEKALIAQELMRHNGCVRKTMEALGVPRKTLYDKMKRHRLEPKAYR